MASFPGAVKTFTSRSNGQVVDASHVNDLQDEVNAIESGYLNGSARLNSSHSTVVALSAGASTLTSLVVSGGSTLNTLQVTTSTHTNLQAGNSTVTGDLTVSGTLSAGSIVLATPVCQVTHSAKQAVANKTWTGLEWDTEIKDSTGMHSTASNSSRITFAGSTGMYQVVLNIEWATNSSLGIRIARFRVNDSSGVAGVTARPNSSGIGLVPPMTLTAVIRAAATTDYVTAHVWNDHGASNSITETSTSHGAPLFAAFRLST